MPYETAYIGIATSPNGNFDHFVRQLKTSHLLGGYWSFQSIDDDRRAMARDFTTPEDVLRAAESSDEIFDEIFIRWVRGANDPNLEMAVSGTPSQHLQTIYELRILLGLPVSSRGQIPLYPISTEPRLRQYWEARSRIQGPAFIVSTSQLPDRPISSPVTPRAEIPSLTPAPHVSPATPESPTGRITRALSVRSSQTAPPTPAARAPPLQRTPGAHTPHTTRPSVARSLSRDTAVSSLPTNTINQQQAPLQITVPPASTSIPPASSASRNVPFIPRAALEWGLESSALPTPSSLVHGISQHNWVHSSSRNSNAAYLSSLGDSRQQQVPNCVADPSQDTITTTSGAIAVSNIPYPSPNLANATRDGLRHAFPAVASSSSLLAGDDTKKHIVARYSATTPDFRTVSSLAANTLPSSVAATMAPSMSSNYASDIHAPRSPDAPHNATPQSPTRESQEPLLDGLSSPVAPQVGSSPLRIEDAPIEEPFATDETTASTAGRPEPAGRTNKLPPDNSRGLQQKLSRLDIGSSDADDTSARANTTEAIPEPWCTYMKGLEELPCMDCGEDDDHRSDCHLGNIEPMQNLTILDYRTLTDAVKMFDPGPWTTHFNPPSPEPEDVETQVRGMAEVIRNENSYRYDTELHDLPNEFMIMLWAFKTSDKVQVVREHDWDSGIGEPETEG